MARQSRVKSSTGIYHVMIRGINHQTIFLDEWDFLKYLYTLEKFKNKLKYIIYSYCLMDNHLHLLIKEQENDLCTVFKSIAASFVYWYNQKYERIGPLFQGRYKSEVVEDENYFKTVIRYIHQNPLKAGLIKDIADYKWSSLTEYTGSPNFKKPRICDTQYVLDMFSENNQKAKRAFMDFNAAFNDDLCMDYDHNLRLKDNEAKEFIIKLANVTIPTEIINFGKERRNKILAACKKRGLSLRQISRLTGISIGVIRNT